MIIDLLADALKEYAPQRISPKDLLFVRDRYHNLQVTLVGDTIYADHWHGVTIFPLFDPATTLESMVKILTENLSYSIDEWGLWS